MAQRRGTSNQERFGLNAATLSATGTILAAPMFLYSVVVSLNDTNATGDLVLADTSASAVADITAGDFLGVRLGAGGVSAAGGGPVIWSPPKPIYIGVGLVASATNCEVSVAYDPAS